MTTKSEFLYQVESGDTPVAGAPGVYTLSAYELASRLAFQFWDSMPDEELWKAAGNGSILQDQPFGAQVDRLLSSPRAKQVIAKFYADWLKLQEVKDLTVLKDDPRFRAFAGTDLPDAALRQEMTDEVSRMASSRSA